LRDTEKRGDQDEEDSNCTFTPMSANKRAEVLEAGLHGHMAVLSSDTVFGQFPRKPRFQICPPVVLQGLTFDDF
jgi:hypothetical protein